MEVTGVQENELLVKMVGYEKDRESDSEEESETTPKSNPGYYD